MTPAAGLRPFPASVRSPRWRSPQLYPIHRYSAPAASSRHGGISKQGDGYLRKLLVVGATAVMRMARKDASRQPWLVRLLERKPLKIATVGLANKTARIAWAVMARKEVYAAAAA